MFAFFSCGKPCWTNDFDGAKTRAYKSGKDIFLVFSGDDWVSTSLPFKENILYKDEFLKTFEDEFIFVNLDFSQTDYAKIDLPETALEEDKENARILKLEYEKKEYFSKIYNIKKWPAVYIISAEGYLLSQIDFDESDVEKTVQEYIEKIRLQNDDVAEKKELIKKVRQSKYLEKANAIDALIKKCGGMNSMYFKDLVLEYPYLDPENETGLLGDYELAGAFHLAFEAIQTHSDPSVPFVEVAEKEHLSPEQRQEAYYMAAYSIVNMKDVQGEKIVELLEKAYDINPAGDNADRILALLDSMRRFAEMQKEAE